MQTCLKTISILAVVMTISCKHEQSKSTNDIVGGQIVEATSEGPERRSTVGMLGCTGSIIADDLVITAAHCYQDAISGGVVVFGTSFSDNARQVVRIKTGWVNPAYNSSSNDFAILQLDETIPDDYEPISMQPQDYPLYRFDRVRLAGFGSDGITATFGNLRSVESYLSDRATNGSLYVRNGTTAACNGDSGGPLFHRRDNTWHLIGVASTAVKDSAGRCVGGNHYTPIRENYATILAASQELTGREDPFARLEKVLPADVIPPKPIETFFETISLFLERDGQFLVEVAHRFPEELRECQFMLEVSRYNDGAVTNYETLTTLAASTPEQTHILSFEDILAPMADKLGSVASFHLNATCGSETAPPAETAAAP